MIHQMNLQHEPFVMIQSGEKTIELRLNDEKRRRIRIGDKIMFTDLSDGAQLVCEVTTLYPSASFATLYAALPLLRCGYTEADLDTAKPEDMEAYYTPAQQIKYGVLGIEIKVCED